MLSVRAWGVTVETAGHRDVVAEGVVKVLREPSERQRAQIRPEAPDDELETSIIAITKLGNGTSDCTDCACTA